MDIEIESFKEESDVERQPVPITTQQSANEKPMALLDFKTNSTAQD